MQKQRFIIVGSGWRARSYVRIAKALPEHFELCAMLCRSGERAERMAAEHGIYTTTSIEECKQMKLDFVVVAVTKSDIASVSMEWMDAGFTVFCETPASQDVEVLQTLWELQKKGKHLVVAEQYTKRPQYQAMLTLLKQGIIGEPDCINISLAHEYHGARLMRAFLGETMNMPFTVSAKTYSFQTVETLSRYERFTDGRVADKKRTVATFEFADGKVAWYDFDSEKYRSPIRHKYVNVQGAKGELRDNRVWFLDEAYEPKQGELVVTEKITRRDSDNPNLKILREVEKIEFVTSEGDRQSIYEPEFGLCGLSEDEIAIALLMKEVDSQGEGELQEALQDCYMAILMQKAVESGEIVSSKEQIWYRR